MWEHRNFPSCNAHMGDGLKHIFSFCQAISATLRKVLKDHNALSKQTAPLWKKNPPTSDTLESLWFSSGLIFMRPIFGLLGVQWVKLCWNLTTLYPPLSSLSWAVSICISHISQAQTGTKFEIYFRLVDGFLPVSKMKQIISAVPEHFFHSGMVMLSRPEYSFKPRNRQKWIVNS